MLLLDAAWLQLQFEPTLSIIGFFWPRYAIFHEPFFHRLTKKPNSPQFCYLSLAHHPIQCQHENVVCWGCPWLIRLISEPPSYKIFNFSNPAPGWRAVEKCPFCPFWLLVWCLHWYMSNQFLKPNKVIQVWDFAHILMKHILAQPDSWGDKNQ